MAVLPSIELRRGFAISSPWGCDGRAAHADRLPVRDHVRAPASGLAATISACPSASGIDLQEPERNTGGVRNHCSSHPQIVEVEHSAAKGAAVGPRMYARWSGPPLSEPLLIATESQRGMDGLSHLPQH